MRKPKVKYYKVKFHCDIEHDHKADISQCIEDDTMTFTDRNKALAFLFECTAPITTLSELVGNKDKTKHNVSKKKPFQKPIRF